MDRILNTLLPVFLVVGLGYFLGRRRFIDEPFLHGFNWLIYWICLPALIIDSLARVGKIPSGTGGVIAVFFGATCLVMGVALAWAWATGLERRRVGTFVQAAFRGNLAFVAIPVLQYALRGQAPDAVLAAMAQAIFVFAPTMLLYNVASVLLLVGSREATVLGNLPGIGRNILTNPLILSCLAGVVLFLVPAELPSALGDTLAFLGRIAAPGALLCVGAGMAFVSMEGRYRSALQASLLKVVLLPLAAQGLSVLLGLDGPARLVLLILSASPTAAASYIMAKELHGDTALAAGAIVFSTVLSIPALAVVLALY